MSAVMEAVTAKINWSAYPSINSFSNVREKAYLILFIVKENLGQDNLTASEISNIIFKKFRKKISPQAVRSALTSKIGEEVDSIHRSDNKLGYKLLNSTIIKMGFISDIPNEDFSANEIIIPVEVVDNCKGYIKKVVFQINGCFRDKYFDACAVMLRRLFETLIIEIYESKKIHERIKDEENNYLSLSKLIKKIINEKEINLSSQTKRHLEKIKLFGDTGAHSRKINLKKIDIVSQREHIRLSAEELVSEIC